METNSDVGNYFGKLIVDDLYAKHIKADSLDMVWLDPQGNVDLSLIGDNLDGLPNGEVYARVKSLHLDAGQIKLDENILYNPGYDPNTKRRTFTATPTTPYDVGDIWLDATTVKRCTTARATGAYVAGDWTATTIDAIADGTTFQRTKSSALTADGLVILDQVVEGTYGLLLTTDISAGHIKLTSQTKASGLWYKASGVEIDAAHGINIYGTDNALTTRATETGTIQCYVGANGKLYAGAGAVLLDASGVTIKGQKLALQDSNGAHGGVIYVDTSGALHIDAAGWAGGVHFTGIDCDGIATIYSLDCGGGAGFYLPKKSSQPTASDGLLVYDTSDGYIKYYSLHDSTWFRIQRTGGW